MRKSFTLIETLVAISIFILCISFVVSGLSRYLSAQQTINNQLIAAYLAQEAIEKIRNLRDTNWLRGRNWLEGISFVTSNCFDFQHTSFPGGTCNCSPLRINNAGFYNCSSGQESIFTREVSVSLEDPDTIRIRVTVRWREKWGERSITVEQKLYNWLGSF